MVEQGGRILVVDLLHQLDRGQLLGLDWLLHEEALLDFGACMGALYVGWVRLATKTRVAVLLLELLQLLFFSDLLVLILFL